MAPHTPFSHKSPSKSSPNILGEDFEGLLCEKGVCGATSYREHPQCGMSPRSMGDHSRRSEQVRRLLLTSDQTTEKWDESGNSCKLDCLILLSFQYGYVSTFLCSNVFCVLDGGGG